MTPARPRWPGLDGLRGLAALSVLLFHLGLLRAGFIGVDVFFVLSGFLITTLLLGESSATGSVRIGQFWVRRILRLYPALVVMTLAVCVVGVGFGHHAAAVFAGGLATLGYVANIWELGGHNTYLLQHTWTLAIEQQFYLVWPIFFTAAARRWRAVLAVVVALGLAVTALSHSPVLQTYNRGAGLVLGCLLAWAIRRPAASALGVLAWPCLVTLGVAAGGLIPSSPLTNWPVTLGAVLAVPAVIGATQEGSFARVLGSPVLRWLGARSYSLYLWHFPLVTVALNNAPASLPHAARVGFALVGSLVAAELSYRYVELPFLRSRERLRPVARALGDQDDERPQRLALDGQPGQGALRESSRPAGSTGVEVEMP